MPRLDGLDVETHTMAGNFSFTGARISGLGATEYTLVDIEVDMSSSVDSFRPELISMIEIAVDACRKSPRSDNLLVRVAAFSSKYPKGTSEIHGFIPLADINPAVYQKLQPGGMTPLRDACFMGIGAMNAYGKLLFDGEYLANGITFIITDGEENASTTSAAMVRDEIKKATKDEILESHLSILIGINAAACSRQLAAFQSDIGITQYVDAGDATKGNLAKLAAFVSQSISSTSQAIGSGGVSQSIAATI
jgi:hypothetical protein